MRGNPESSDAVSRWDAIQEVTREFGIRIRPELIVQLEGMESAAKLGYPSGKVLLARNVPFTALFAYNDISAIGAMRDFSKPGCVFRKMSRSSDSMTSLWRRIPFRRLPRCGSRF